MKLFFVFFKDVSHYPKIKVYKDVFLNKKKAEQKCRELNVAYARRLYFYHKKHNRRWKAQDYSYYGYYYVEAKELKEEE